MEMGVYYSGTFFQITSAREMNHVDDLMAAPSDIPLHYPSRNHGPHPPPG